MGREQVGGRNRAGCRRISCLTCRPLLPTPEPSRFFGAVACVGRRLLGTRSSDQSRQQVSDGSLEAGDVAVRASDEHGSLQGADDRPRDVLRRSASVKGPFAPTLVDDTFVRELEQSGYIDRVLREQGVQ